MVHTPKEVQVRVDNSPAENLLGQVIRDLQTHEFPSNFVEWIRACVDCDNVALIAFFQDRNPLILKSFSDHPSVHAKLETEYVDAAYLLDPFHDLHIKKAPSGVYRLREVAPDHFQRNQYYINYYRDTTLVDEIAFVSHPAVGVTIQTCLGRDSNSDAGFMAKEIAQAKRISPVVSSLVEINWSALTTTGEYLESETTIRLVEAVQNSLGVSLTRRQAEVALYILRGHSSASTGLNMNISWQTVKVFRRQLYKRLNISSQGELFNILLPLLAKS